MVLMMWLLWCGGYDCDGYNMVVVIVKRWCDDYGEVNIFIPISLSTHLSIHQPLNLM